MRIVKIVFILALLGSCSKRSKIEQVQLKAEKGDSKKEILQESGNDSLLYINKIEYFSETDEFYVPISFKKPLSNNIYEILENKTDSVILDNGEKSRKRLPMKLAKDIFDLSQLEEVKIYNINHQFVTNARLKRTEYLVDLNGYFIAVFSPEKKMPKHEDSFYCLGTAKVELKGIKAIEIENEQLTATIKKELNAHPQYVSRVQHLKIMPYNTIFSIYAFVDSEGGAISYLTEFKNNKLTVLHKLKDEVAFEDFLPIPIERNGKPILLINIILPDSDAVDEYLVGTFNSSEYVLEKDNRIASK